MIYKKLNLPITDSLRFHYPIKYRNPLRVPVTLNINDHEVEIRAHLDFAPKLLMPYENLKKDEPDTYLSEKPEGFTYADAICEGIRKNWEGMYHLPWLSHDKKDFFWVRVNIIRKDDPDSGADPRQKYARIKFAPFFARQVLLGKNGVESLKPVGKLSEYERKCLDEMLPGLKNDIQQGVDFVQNCGA